MQRRGRVKTNYLLYYPVSFFGYLLTISPFLVVKLIAVIAGASVLIFLDKSVWTILLSIVAGCGTLVILFPIAKYLTGKGLLLSEFGKQYKKSFTNTFGADYKEPTFQEFGLLPEEYYSYNRAFKLDVEFISFLSVPVTLFVMLKLISERGIVPAFYAFMVAFVVYFITKYLCLFFNYKLLNKKYKYNKIQQYNKARLIHKKIQDEIEDGKNVFKGWDD